MKKILFGIGVLLSGSVELTYAAIPSQGGSGILSSDSFNRCFPVQSRYVDQLCADYKIHWKLWTLMGEPVGNYALEWQVLTLRFKNQSSDNPFLLASLKQATEKIEFYLDASVTVKSPHVDWAKSTVHYHRFNTGTAVKANKGISYNSPGSPDWGKVFIQRSPCKADAMYANVADSKKAFQQGIQLSALNICSGTSISFLGFDSEVDRFCASDEGQKYSFCAKKDKEEPKINNQQIDDAFAKFETQTKAKTTHINGGSKIDDVFGKLEKQKGSNISTVHKLGDMDSQFKQADLVRKEREEARKKAEQERRSRPMGGIVLCTTGVDC